MLCNLRSSASLDALEQASSANQPTITTTYQRAGGSDTRALGALEMALGVLLLYPDTWM